MTAMEQALTTAGVKLPTAKERVWRVIKESGGKGMLLRELSKRLTNIPATSISVALVEMKERGMVTSVPELEKKSGRTFGRYFTDLEDYEMLPKIISQVAPKEAPTVAQVTVTSTPASRTTDLDHLTIAQARELYKVLHKMFGREA